MHYDSDLTGFHLQGGTEVGWDGGGLGPKEIDYNIITVQGAA